MDTKHTIEPIGYIQTPFKEKFGIPRQPNLCAAKGTIVLNETLFSADSVNGLLSHSHIWLLFLFDQNIEKGWKETVRPPRLGGNKKVGVFATRSTFRPNAIGMSVVKLLSVEQVDKQLHIGVQGVDLVNNTPIVDIKPYIPYSDAIIDATSSLANNEPLQTLNVVFSLDAEASLKNLKIKDETRKLIVDVLSQDPRPSYKKNKLDSKIYGITLENINITWQVTNEICEVVDVKAI